MEISEIKGIIQEQRIEMESLMGNGKIIEREVGSEWIKDALSQPNIAVILGVRRCGKSVFAWLTAKERKSAYINFDDERLYGIGAEELNLILKAFYELYDDPDYIILDEIQNVEGWELFANRLRRSRRVIITGSNSSLLSGELASRITGRHVDKVLFPFSFGEFLAYNEIKPPGKNEEYTTKDSAVMEKSLETYLEKGGFPEAYGLPGITKSIFGDIVSKDIIRRYRLKNMAALESIVKYLVSNSAKEISYSKLKSIFGIRKVETVKNYMGYIGDTYLVFTLQRFSFKLKQQFIAPRKAYCIDTGIINAISFKTGDDTGRKIEGLVAVELKRRASYSDTQTEIYYWKDHLQREVDFVLKRGNAVTRLIQVSFVGGEVQEEVMHRELESLVHASQELRCNNLLLITWSREGLEEYKGKKIILIPLWKWLLKK